MAGTSRNGSWVRNYEVAQFAVPPLPPSTTTTDDSRPSSFQPFFHDQRQYQPLEYSPPPSPLLFPLSLPQGFSPLPMSSTQSLPATNSPHPPDTTTSSSSSTQPTSLNSRSSSSYNNELPPPRSPTSPTPIPPVSLRPAPRTFSPSPLGPSSPFARPGSTGSTHINRIASEESRVLSSTPLPGALSSRGSMILYRFADDALLSPSGPPSTRQSQYLTDQSYNTSGTTDEQGLLAPPNPFASPGKRGSVTSNRDSIFSLSSDSKYPASLQHKTERGLIAYAYDPEVDETGPTDDVDLLHDPNEKDHRGGGRAMGWRGFLNIATIVILLVALLTLFVAYPVIAFVNDNGRNAKIVANTRINSTGQAEEAPFGFANGVTTHTTTTFEPAPPSPSPPTTAITTPTPTETQIGAGIGAGADGDGDTIGTGDVGPDAGGVVAPTAGAGGVADPATGAGAVDPTTGDGAVDPTTGDPAVDPATGDGAVDPATGTGPDTGAGAGTGDDTGTGAGTTLKRRIIPLESRRKSRARARNFSSS